MQAWRVHRNGEPSEVMRLEETDRPTPADGQVLPKGVADGTSTGRIVVLPSGAAR